MRESEGPVDMGRPSLAQEVHFPGHCEPFGFAQDKLRKQSVTPAIATSLADTDADAFAKAFRGMPIAAPHKSGCWATVTGYARVEHWEAWWR